ncbi:hypothetical protein PRUPE_7G034800 [Prunus persica]|uniref:CCHC-type domain-containing protein n=1 Tax=Prunus persica TaxID=3760 RepID=A0A251N696_PRUPE|nr:hypothetical protein PRUPE_7G034800 [Prunus persica]
MQPDDFVDWLNTVERIFDYKEVSDEKKVKIVAIKLKRNASAWWEQLQTRRDRTGKSKIKTWEKMKKELKRKFLPENYLQTNFLKLHNLRQGNWAIEEYTEEFDLLTMRCGLIEEEEHTVARYLGGMRREIHDVVVLQQYWSYDDVFKLAIQVEKQIKTRSRSTRIEGSEQKNSWMTKGSSNSEPGKHEAPKTNAPEHFTANKPKGIKCFKCSGIGHIASECPNRKIEMVDKLNLKTEKKPISYKLSWVKKGNEVVVNQRCLVTFSIGQKPWQFDRKATHDGYKNTYTFIKDGTKVILGPSQSEFNVKSTKIGAGSFLTKGKFLKEAEESGDMYMLMVKESNPDVLNFPKELIPLLQEFNDVIPEELPDGLPPMRDIQHCIDLIPGHYYKKEKRRR